MTRLEQIQFCKKCIKRKFDFEKGVICSLTNDLAKFEERCNDYKPDPKISEEEKNKNYKPSRNKFKEAIEIIVWWEIRRLIYNAILLVSGIICIAIMEAIVEVEPGEDLFEPIFLIVFAIICNLFYTLGWIVEIFAEKDEKFGPTLFIYGTFVSMFIIFIPAIIHLIRLI